MQPASNGEHTPQSISWDVTAQGQLTLEAVKQLASPELLENYMLSRSATTRHQ
jgi:hypothetical protein